MQLEGIERVRFIIKIYRYFIGFLIVGDGQLDIRLYCGITLLDNHHDQFLQHELEGVRLLA
jgi:hypothetical protein